MENNNETPDTYDDPADVLGVPRHLPLPGFLYTGWMHYLVREALVKVGRLKKHQAALLVKHGSLTGIIFAESRHDDGDCENINVQRIIAIIPSYIDPFDIPLSKSPDSILVIGKPRYLQRMRTQSGEPWASRWLGVGPVVFNSPDYREESVKNATVDPSEVLLEMAKLLKP